VRRDGKSNGNREDERVFGVTVVQPLYSAHRKQTRKATAIGKIIFLTITITTYNRFAIYLVEFKTIDYL